MEVSCNTVAPGSKRSLASDVVGSKWSAGNIGATDTPGTTETVGHTGAANSVQASTYQERQDSSSISGMGKARQTSQVTSHTPSNDIQDKLVKRCKENRSIS